MGIEFEYFRPYSGKYPHYTVLCQTCGPEIPESIKIRFGRRKLSSLLGTSSIKDQALEIAKNHLEKRPLQEDHQIIVLELNLFFNPEN